MPVELPHLTARQAASNEYVYFTGGMVGIQFVEGWGLVPTREAGRPHAIGPLELPGLFAIAEEAGCRLVGFNKMVKTGEHPPWEHWRPAVPSRDKRGRASGEVWHEIARRARAEGNQQYAHIAQTFANSLQASGQRLKDIGNLQLTQLKWALKDGVEPGVSFSNEGVHEIYLALHSLAQELLVARGALFALAGMPAPAETPNALTVIDKQHGASVGSSDERLAQLVTSECAAKLGDNWLAKLDVLCTGAMPNPEGLSFRLHERATSCGPVLTLSLASRSAVGEAHPDPMGALLDPYNAMQALAERAAETNAFAFDRPEADPSLSCTAPWRFRTVSMIGMSLRTH